MSKLGTIAVIATIMAPLPAIAYSQEDVEACTPDAMRLCMHAIPSASRVTECLVQNKKQLSAACTIVFNRPHGVTAERERPVKAQTTSY